MEESSSKPNAFKLKKQQTEKKIGSEPYKINVNKVYHFKERLHSGEYGTVNVYYSQILQKNVAIKTMSKIKIPFEIFKKFLPQSLSIMRRLNHPNIVKCYEAFENGINLYFVMELVEKGCLTNYIQNRIRLDHVIYHKFFKQIIEAVDYCFNEKIFNRKICCENILITKDENVKLCDFLYARRFDSNIKLYETYCGALAYTAPEILECKPYNPYLTDIWSVGIVVYAMVYGVVPFDSSNYANLLKQVKATITYRRYPDTPFEVINLMHNMITPVKFRWDIMMIKNDLWLFKRNTLIEQIETTVSKDLKPWKEIKECILDRKQKMEEKIMAHIAKFATESEFKRIQKRRAKKKDIVPENMKWLFEFY